MTGGKVRKAKIDDAKKIKELINIYARKELMLPRSLNDIYEAMRDYWVYESEDQILGCAALHIDWEDLAEIRSTAVDNQHKRRGIGKMLVQKCIEEAKELGVKRVFVLTYETDFFKKMGFSTYKKEKLPHKIWGECLRCTKFPDCDEEAMIMHL